VHKYFRFAGCDLSTLIVKLPVLKYLAGRRFGFPSDFTLISGASPSLVLITYLLAARFGRAS